MKFENGAVQNVSQGVQHSKQVVSSSVDNNEKRDIVMEHDQMDENTSTIDPIVIIVKLCVFADIFKYVRKLRENRK